MPKNNKKKQEINSQEVKKKVDQDLVVHNMPANTGLLNSSSSDASGNMQMSGEKKHFKTIGVVIIVGGIILVGVLIYLSYKFIISPASNNQVPISTNNTNQEQLVEENTNNVASSTENDSEEFSGQEEQVPLSVASSTPSEIIEIDEDGQTVEELDGLNNQSEEDGQNEVNNEEELLPILDADSDGLSDDEENALFTSLFQADSDGDGYYDLSEIENGYNPSGEGPLEDSSALTRYYNSVANYSLLYPANWSLASSNNDYTVVISTPDNSLLQISVQDNARLQGILSWYEETIGQSADYDKLMSKDDWEGIMGEKDQNFYLTDKSRTNIYVISYIPSISERLNYQNIFNLMVNSFRIE